MKRKERLGCSCGIHFLTSLKKNNNVLLLIFETERERGREGENGGGAEREGVTESKADSRL